MKQLAAEGKFGNERVLIVKTPLDTAIQRRSEQALEDMLRQYGRQYDAEQGAIVVMDVDGAVRAMVGGRDYGQSQFNRATDALRQPGSSFKPFVYAAALTVNPKLRPTSTVVDAPICLGNWCPQNYSRSFSGSMPLVSALARSINSIPVRMSVEIGKAAGATGEGRARGHHRHRAADGPDPSAPGFDLAADRRRRGDRHRHDRLLCGLRQWRQAGDALRHLGGAQRAGRGDLPPRPRRAAAAGAASRRSSRT